MTIVKDRRDPVTERDHYIRHASRITLGRRRDLFVDEADEALYAARAKILSDAARGSGCNDRG